MTLSEYQSYVAGISYGKRLPGALYVFRDATIDFGPELNRLLAQLVIVFEVGPAFNLIKFRTDELKMSFLCYPEFMDASSSGPAARCHGRPRHGQGATHGLRRKP